MLIENLGRLKVRKGKERREAQKELEQSIHLVKAPQVLRQDQSLTLPKIKVEVSQPKSEKNQAMEEWFC
jgi:large subunit ribosomal protein L24e